MKLYVTVGAGRAGELGKVFPKNWVDVKDGDAVGDGAVTAVGVGGRLFPTTYYFELASLHTT